MDASGNSRFQLRAMQASDSEMITRLITEFGGDMTTRFLVDAYLAITCGTEYQTLGVVVECEGQDGLVGMGTLRFLQAQFNGETYPLAFLDGLKVREAFRGRGLGAQIANWRIQQARDIFGERCILSTGMLQENQASHGVAKKWCREFIEPAMEVLIMPVREQRPKAPAGMAGGELEPGQFEEFAARQNRYYHDYNFYPPSSPEAIAHALAVEVEGRKPYRYFCVVDQHGNLLAGAKTWARGLLKSDTINQLPAPLRLINRVAHLLPPDYTIRDISVSELWYEPGQAQAARFLWQLIRWACKDQGNSVVIGMDPRDPMQELLALKPWHQPRPKVTMALHGPTEVNRDQLIFSIGRV